MSKGGFFLNAGGFMASMDLMKSAIPTNAKTNMEVATAHLEGEIKDRSPVDTGHLRASYSSVVEQQGDTTIGHTGTNVPYAEAQEMWGTPHVRPSVDANRQKLVQIMAEQTLSGAISHLG